MGIFSRKKKEYETLSIGNQIWMAEDFEHKNSVFFDWHKAQTICPKGWKLPSKSDFQELLDYFDSNSKAIKFLTSKEGLKMKFKGAYVEGIHKYVNKNVGFWSSTDAGGRGNTRYAYFLFLSKDKQEVEIGDHHTHTEFCIRCIKK